MWQLGQTRGVSTVGLLLPAFLEMAVEGCKALGQRESAGQDRGEVAELLLHGFWCIDRGGNLPSQELPVALAKTMDGGFDGAFADAEVRRKQRVWL